MEETVSGSMETAHEFSVEKHNVPARGPANEQVEQYVPTFDDAPRNHSNFLRDILGSCAVSPILTADDDVVTNMGWDMFSNIDQQFPDLEHLSTVDLQSLNTFFPDFMDSGAPSKDNEKSFEDIASTAATQAFKKSGWDWGPTQQDCSSVERRHFILPAGCDPSEGNAPRSQVSALPVLKPGDRNRLLSLLLQHCAKEPWIAIAPTFPSELFLDQLLRRFLASQRTSMLPWFHATALQLDTISDEFLASMIGAGACLAPVVPVQRFGYCMPEVLRYAILARWADDNSTSRDIQLLHSWLTQAEVATWSGNKRQMEIGESNYQQAITIIRRARWLRQAHYKYICPESTDDTQTLYAKWQDWIAQESRKRLIYRVFVFDARLSMLNHVNPLMSHIEMRIPLPAPNRIWWAATPLEWKTEYANAQQSTLAGNKTLVEAVRTPMSGQSTSSTDTQSTLYTLYGLWSLVWEHQTLHEMPYWEDSVTADTIAHASSMVPARRQPLLQGLNALRDSLGTEGTPVCAQSNLTLEYLSMATLVPLYALHAFAGREGENEARRVYPILQQWTQTREARQSVWHAGQIYRIAGEHPVHALNNMCVMFLHQASITLWVYGVVMSARRSRDISSLPLSPDLHYDELVWLNGDACMTTRQFIGTAEGVPALKCLNNKQWDNGQFRFVEDAKGTMNIAVQLLRRPLGAGEGMLGIVESMTRLMEELARVAEMLEM